MTCAFGVNNVGYAMMCFGASSCVSSFIIQSIVRKTGSFIIILIGWLVYMATIVWLFFWEISEQPLYVVFITISVLGFFDVAVGSQIHGKKLCIIFMTFRFEQTDKHLLYPSHRVWSDAYDVHIKIKLPGRMVW